MKTPEPPLAVSTEYRRVTDRQTGIQTDGQTSDDGIVKGSKGSGFIYTCIAFIVVPHTQGAQVRITQCYLQITPCLPLPRKHSPDGASPDWGCGHQIAAYYSFIYPEMMKGWVGLVGEILVVHAMHTRRAVKTTPINHATSGTLPAWSHLQPNFLTGCQKLVVVDLVA